MMCNNRLRVEIPGMQLENPIIPASGTFGFGYEFTQFYDINILGTFSTKGTTLEERFGNIGTRIAEGKSTMMNCIGLQNPGVDKVVAHEFEELKKVYGKQVIANVGGHSDDDYIQAVKRLSAEDIVGAIELNISCPNVKEGGMAFGTHPDVASSLVKKCKEVSLKPIIVKLSPNVTDIVAMAKAVEVAGADAISLINTFVGMRINLKTRKPIMGNIRGGVSGPGVFPMALRMVYDVSRNVNIPVIGLGGVETAYDVVEMMLAGATAVQVGTMNLIDPYACKKIIEDLPKVMDELSIENLKDIIGKGE